MTPILAETTVSAHARSCRPSASFTVSSCRPVGPTGRVSRSEPFRKSPSWSAPLPGGRLGAGCVLRAPGSDDRHTGPAVRPRTAPSSGPLRRLSRATLLLEARSNMPNLAPPSSQTDPPLSVLAPRRVLGAPPPPGSERQLLPRFLCSRDPHVGRGSAFRPGQDAEGVWLVGSSLSTALSLSSGGPLGGSPGHRAIPGRASSHTRRDLQAPCPGRSSSTVVRAGLPRREAAASPTRPPRAVLVLLLNEVGRGQSVGVARVGTVWPWTSGRGLRLRVGVSSGGVCDHRGSWLGSGAARGPVGWREGPGAPGPEAGSSPGGCPLHSARRTPGGEDVGGETTGKAGDLPRPPSSAREFSPGVSVTGYGV